MVANILHLPDGHHQILTVIKTLSPDLHKKPKFQDNLSNGSGSKLSSSFDLNIEDQDVFVVEDYDFSHC